ncbi:FAD/NAD-P-binding domain-containing protein [Trametes elegans]|nr:FAD/NAD-P-binding domain-containing protein [Trametes elegans]
MAQANSTRLRVAIIGAGLGGLLLALFLEKNTPDVAVDIYESTAELSEIGAGIGFWPRMWEILAELGLEDELLEIAGTRDRTALKLRYMKADEPAAVEFYQLPAALFTFHRSDLQRTLAKHLRTADKIHFSKRLVRYDASTDADGPITLHFKDGSSAECNVLVGSDGIRSAVRGTMYNALADEAEHQGDGEGGSRMRGMIDPLWSRETAYRSLIETRRLTELGFAYAHLPLILFGKSKHVISYPISRGELVNVAAFVSHPERMEGERDDRPWVSRVASDEVFDAFVGWDPSVRLLLESMEDPLRWSIHECRELPTYVCGRVALIGDAAHAMRPHQGAGAGQAMEDGYILATILAHPGVTLTNVARVLEVYDRIRRPAAQEVQRRSRANGMLYELCAGGWEGVSKDQSRAGGFPQEVLGELGRRIEREMDWMLSGSVKVGREEAVEMVRRALE